MYVRISLLSLTVTYSAAEWCNGTQRCECGCCERSGCCVCLQYSWWFWTAILGSLALLCALIYVIQIWYMNMKQCRQRAFIQQDFLSHQQSIRPPASETLPPYAANLPSGHASGTVEVVMDHYVLQNSESLSENGVSSPDINATIQPKRSIFLQILNNIKKTLHLNNINASVQQSYPLNQEQEMNLHQRTRGNGSENSEVLSTINSLPSYFTGEDLQQSNVPTSAQL